MKAVRRVAPLASPKKSDLLNVMLFIIISPYLFNVVAVIELAYMQMLLVYK